MQDLVEEAAVFPLGAHDDQVDALTQALRRATTAPRITGASAANYRLTTHSGPGRLPSFAGRPTTRR